MRQTVLAVGDFPGGTGFGSVMGNAIFPLAKDYDLHVLGVNYLGDPHSFDGVKIYPAWAGGDMLGFRRIQEIVLRVRPDVIILFSDLNVIHGWVAQTLDIVRSIGSKYILYYPIDAECLPKADMICTTVPEVIAHATYTQFGKEAFMSSARRWTEEGPDAPRFTEPKVIGHGVDTSVFFPKDRMECRKKFKLGEGVTEDTIIVLNANRNQKRKRLDLSVMSFAEAMTVNKYQKLGLDLRIWFHCDKEGEGGIGWNLPYVFFHEMTRRGFTAEEMSNRLIVESLPSMALPPPSVVNDMNNASDFGLNTSDAEGWGLNSHEMAACRKIQITPSYAASRELWGGLGLGCAHTVAGGYDMDMGTFRRTPDPFSAADLIISYARMSPETRARAEEEFYQRAVSFSWDSVREAFSEMVKDAVSPKSFFKKRKRD